MLITIEKIISRFEFVLKRELDGRLLGTQRQNRLGDGYEIRDFREYEPGDPVRDIDHKQSAKAGSWQVRQYDADLSQDVWLLMDVRPSMRIGAGPHTKFNHALHLLAMAYVWVRTLTTRLGAIQLGVGNERGLQIRPIRQSARHALDTFEALLRSETVEKPIEPLDQELEHTLRQLGRRSIVLIATSTSDLAVLEPLAKHSARHEIIFINVRDAVDDMTVELSGWNSLYNVDTGNQASGYVTRGNRRRERNRRQTALATFEERISELPVKYLQVQTTDNPLTAFIDFARKNRHERRRSA